MKKLIFFGFVFLLFSSLVFALSSKELEDYFISKGFGDHTLDGEITAPKEHGKLFLADVSKFSTFQFTSKDGLRKPTLIMSNNRAQEELI